MMKESEITKKGLKNMKIFKLHTGNEEARNLTRDNYKEAMLELPREERGDYSEPTKNGRRYFAVCPACDNPTQIIGLYTKSDNVKLPYAKHYNRDSKVAKHSEQAYQFCPFAFHSYAVDKKSRKKNFGDFEKNIYVLLRENFDIAVYIAKKASGIYFTRNQVKRMASEYYMAEGYMYYHATSYNIPWMLLYFIDTSRNLNCNNLIINKDSELYDFLKTQENVSFESLDDEKAKVKVTSGELSIGFPKHQISGEEEILEMCVVRPGEILKRIKLPVDQTFFLHIVNHRKYPKNDEIIRIGKERLPEEVLEK